MKAMVMRSFRSLLLVAIALAGLPACVTPSSEAAGIRDITFFVASDTHFGVPGIEEGNRRLIDELNKQLDVKQKVMDSEGKFSGLIPVDVPVDTTTVNITDQIDAYFSHGPADAAAVADR